MLLVSRSGFTICVIHYRLNMAAVASTWMELSTTKQIWLRFLRRNGKRPRFTNACWRMVTCIAQTRGRLTCLRSRWAITHHRCTPPSRSHDSSDTKFYTPTVSSSAQPIELVWCVVKNKIAQDPALTIGELGVKIGTGLRVIRSKMYHMLLKSPACWKYVSASLVIGQPFIASYNILFI